MNCVRQCVVFVFLGMALQTATAATVQGLSTNTKDSAVGQIQEVRSNHFVVQQDGVNFFILKLAGAMDQTIRIDLKNVTAGSWWSVNPLYVYAGSADDPTLFKTTFTSTNAPTRKATNKSILPDTTGQVWQFITNVWMESYVVTNTTSIAGDGIAGNVTTVTTNGIFCFKHTFTSDTALVAMRYPYTAGYSDRYFASLKQRIEKDKLDFAAVHDIGKSKAGHVLRVVTIGLPDKTKKNPCVLMYGREDGTEPDGSWVAEGALEFLLSNDPEAKRIRSGLTVIIIPMLDPDAAEANAYKGICQGFDHERMTCETLAYSRWFRQWVDAGNRLDLTFGFHNVEGGQVKWHAFCLPGAMDNDRYELQCALVEKVLKPAMGKEDVALSKTVIGHGDAPYRLSGFLARYYGPLLLGFELNCQSPSRHLTLAELRNMGRICCQGAAEFLGQADGRKLLGMVDKKRGERERMMKACAPNLENETNAVKVEWLASVMAAIDESRNNRNSVATHRL